NCAYSLTVSRSDKAPISINIENGDTTVVTDAFPIDTTYITWTATDSKKNSVSCTHFVAVIDTVAPVLACAKDTTVDVSEGCKADVKLTVPSVFDNCAYSLTVSRSDKAPISINIENGDTTVVTDAFFVDKTVITWRATDRNGNFSECDQVVSVIDTIAPAITCADTIKVMAGEYCVAPGVKIEMPEIVENCGDYTLSVSRSDGGYISVSNGAVRTDAFPLDTTYITWTATDNNENTSYCAQVIVVDVERKPVIDCSKLKSLKFIAKGDCEVNVDETMIPVPVAKVPCSDDVIAGVGLREDGSSIYGNYFVGESFINWTFTNTEDNLTATCVQKVSVLSDKRLEKPCYTLSLDTIIVEIPAGQCSVSAEDVLPKDVLYAKNPCTGKYVKGELQRPGGIDLNEPFSRGVTSIFWVFVDESNTLTFPVDACEQFVKITGPKMVDCDNFVDKTVSLALSECSLEAAKLNLSAPEVTNPCYNGAVMVPDTVRSSGKAMTEPYAVGSDTVTWTYVLPVSGLIIDTVSCKQVITVKDTLAPVFDCSQLESPIVMSQRAYDEVMSYEKAVQMGLKMPVVTDACGDVTMLPRRSDGKALEDDFERGDSVVVTWVFADIYGNADSCEQVVIVEDLVAPILDCPKFREFTFACVNDLPEAYGSYEEFVMANGSVSEEHKVLKESFGSYDSIPEGMSLCDAEIWRVYHMTDFLGRKVSCTQMFELVDTVAPVLSMVVDGKVKHDGTFVKNLKCTDELPEFPVPTAKDNCSEVTVEMTEVSTRGEDPDSCSYYTYEIKRTWSAVDACGNRSLPISYVISVVDDTKPTIALDDSWAKDTVFSINMKNCEFGAPNLVSMLPKDFEATDDCAGEGHVRVYQKPDFRSVLDKTTKVYVYVEDACHNFDTISRVVYVPTVESVVSIIAKDTAICGFDGNKLNLWSPEIRSASGNIYMSLNNGMVFERTSQVFFDCYRDSISEESLVFSDNRRTYYNKYFKGDKVEYNSLKAKLTSLTRMTQSGTYYYVAMDTFSYCTDTVKIELTVNERPRIALEHPLIDVCEDDSIPLFESGNELYSRANVCVNEMGTFPVTDEGWMVDGNVYRAEDTVRYREYLQPMLYYATNLCGTSTSKDSYFWLCGDSLWSESDSLAMVGSKENLDAWRADTLYALDTINVRTHHRFTPDEIVLSTEPNDKARVWIGEDVSLSVRTKKQPKAYFWYKVNETFDGHRGVVYDRFGEIFEGDVNLFDMRDELIAVKDSADDKPFSMDLVSLRDSALYYVLVTDSVCPAMASNIVSIDVMDKLPTAITPYVFDGMNDAFMKGHYIRVFNRYGQWVYDGEDGWDGTYRGLKADPGVYYYEVIFNGVVRQGSIEVVKF
ncbi:MAG: gliding motility-associated C-terminal domain-containing protein, partial [Paludibacteraceae bacterium]|nr:gliding motility-associated C-terminal domain-containing protein [Paludibacteraceae bacterium]